MASNFWERVRRFRLPGLTCTTCHNLRIDDQTTSKQVIWIDVRQLAESADGGDCPWCSLVYRSLLEVGAKLPVLGESTFACIVAQRNKPFYVEWQGVGKTITAEIYQIDGKCDPIVIDSLVSGQDAKEPKAMARAYLN